MANASSDSSSIGGRPPQAAVRFTRRTSSGRVVSLSRDDDIDMSGESEGQNDYINYTVMMPPTPDNQPGTSTSDNNSNKQEGAAASYVGPTRFASESQQQVMDDDGSNDLGRGGRRGGRPNKMERRVSVTLNSENNKSMLLRSHTQDFDHNRWLFETKGTYGIGNAFWKDENAFDDDTSISDLMEKPWKPLTRKVRISGAVISPYRLLVLMRMVVLGLFLSWRIRNPNYDALWLWAMSVVCEIWFSLSWFLDVLPKLNPINRSADIAALHEKFDQLSPPDVPTGRSDLPGIDVFVSTVDPEKEPPLITANTVLSILSVDYPVEKISCYISDDGGSILIFEAMAETVKFAEVWVPFCRKHNIEPRNPDAYFNIKKDPTKNKKLADFVKDRRWIKREYDEFKVRINRLPETIRERSKMYNSKEEKKEKRLAKDKNDGELPSDQPIDVPKATWMADGTHWPGNWHNSTPDHSKGDHAGILQVMSKVPEQDLVTGFADEKRLDFTGVDIRIPMFVYVSREKRFGYEHNKKAGAMNALVRASAILSNGPFILNLLCDHYIYNSHALKEGICYMMDRGGDRICYIQFPKRFEGIDPSDRYANHNTVFFDGNMRALDGLQGPMYVGTGCMFRRYALYGFEPPRFIEHTGVFGRVKTKINRNSNQVRAIPEDDDTQPLTSSSQMGLPQKFGSSNMFTDTIPVAEFQARPLADHKSVQNGRPPGALLMPRPPLDALAVAEAIAVISCWYEDNTEWGDKIGWIYGSMTEDVMTGYRMHSRGWRSIYCLTKRDAFHGTAPINLADRLHQVLRWASGSVEIFFSRNNAIFGSRRLKFLQRIAYLNVSIYPFTSIFMVTYCFMPALCLFSGHFIVQGVDVAFLTYLLLITVCASLISFLEVKWSRIGLEELWRNEQFWVIGSTSSHLFALIQGLVRAIARVEISFTLTAEPAGRDEDQDGYANLHTVKWTSLFIVPLTIIIVNLVAAVLGFMRTVYSVIPQWSKLTGNLFFSFLVLSHMYPFAKGLMGRRGRVPTIVYVWSGLLSVTVALLWISVDPPVNTGAEGGAGILV